MLSDSGGKLIKKYTKDYVVYDLETTGISPMTDRIVEISAIKVIDKKVVDEFSTLINPEMHIPYWATRVNRITDAMVADAPLFCEVIGDFLDFIGDMVLVGHNIHGFDMKFVYRDCMEYFHRIPDNDYIDTLVLARACLPQLSHHKLTDIAQYYSLSIEGAHRALNDCRMTQQVFERLNDENYGKGMGKNGIKGGVRECPLCGALLKKRKGRYGEFYGCTGYPVCKYTEKV